MLTILIPLSDFLVDPKKKIDLTALSSEQACKLIRESYGFVSSAVEVTIENGVAIISVPEETSRKVDEALDWFERGITKAKQGDYESAIRLLTKTLEYLPLHTDARRNLAMAYLESGNQEEAINQLIDVLRLDPKDIWAHVLLGNIYGMYRKDFDSAEPFYRKAYEINPDDSYLLHNYASLKGSKKQIEEAIRMFERAIDLNPSYPNSYLGLAMLLVGENRNSDSLFALRRLFSQAQKEDRRSEPVYEQARRLNLQLNREQAEKDYETIMTFVRERATSVEAISGFPVDIVEDDSLEGVTAKTELAWRHRTDRHRILYRTAPSTIVPHLIAHELEHILLEHEARAGGVKKVFAVDDRHKSFVSDSIRVDVQRLQMDADVASGFVKRLINGLTNQLYNCPLDMVIEKRLFNKYDVLHPSQFVALCDTQSQNSAVLIDKEIKRITPRTILRSNLAMNCAYAIFTDWLYKGVTDFASSYKASSVFPVGKRLFEAFQDVEAKIQPGDEYELILRFASILGLTNWFSIVDDDSESERPQGPTNPELLEQKESATMMYCLDTLKRFEKMSAEKIREVAFEVGMLGTTGIDYTKPERRYSLKSIPGEQFSGLQLLVFMYVGFKKTDPSLNTGLKFDNAYELALKLYRSAGS